MLTGYCLYYVVETMFNPLPDTLEEAEASFDYLQVRKKLLWARGSVAHM